MKRDTLLEYLELGWHVFPIVEGGKAPLTAHGFKDASNAVIQIDAWLAKYPNANWAVSTGPSNLLVVDLDSYKEGFNESNTIIELGLANTAKARTASGGLHYYYKREGDVESRSPMKMVDVRASTGYVLLPGSSLANAGVYEWLTPPSAGSIAKASLRLLAKIKDAKSDKAASASLVSKDEVFLKAGSGRWETIRRHAGVLRSLGWGQRSISDAIASFAEYQCEPDDSISSGKLKDLAQWVCEKPAINQKNPTIVQKSTVMVRYPDGTQKEISSAALSKALFSGAVVIN